MGWSWFWLAFLIANAAALGFYSALRLNETKRTIVWMVCSALILLSPFCIPQDARPLRFVACVAAVTLLFKVYDAYRSPALALDLGFAKWLAYLPNWFWFVLKRVPRQQPAARDWRRLAIDAPLMVGAVALCVLLLRLDWSGIPFLLQHSVKVMTYAATVMLIGRMFAALFRLLVMPATDPIVNPFAARTPADFWRRWNRPFRDFFDEYVFQPMGGARRPVPATLAVFAVSGLMHEYAFDVATGRVQGWQILFFMLQGCAAAATLRIRPRRQSAPLWWAATLIFNLATTMIFFRSVDGVIAFYQR